MLSREDMEKLIVVSDQLMNMNQCLEKLCGGSYGAGDFRRIDALYDVIQNNVSAVFKQNLGNGESTSDLLYSIILNQKLTPAERTNMIMSEFIP